MASPERMINNISLLEDITLTDDELTEEAKNQFGFYKDILHAQNLNRLRIIQNHLLTPVGRHMLLSLLNTNHENWRKVLNYVAANKEILRQSMPSTGPLIICGLPRTGSTLLYNLLACDPNSRAPLFTGMHLECVPPISRTNLEEQKRRAHPLKLMMHYRNQLVGRPNMLSEGHPIFDIEEDHFILMHSGVNFFVKIVSSSDEVEFDKWFYDDTNKDFAYNYHEIFLCMLNSVDSPQSHWVLKAPLHSFFLNTLTRHYPSASLIMTHRCLDEVLPSMCRFMLTFNSDYCDTSNPENQLLIKTQTIQWMEHMIDCIMRFRTREHSAEEHSRKAIFDVQYEDLMKQPIVTVHKIYKHFGLNWSSEFETNMKSWLRENPQGKQGRHTYNLEQFGFTHEDIEQRYADYIRMFLSPSSKSQ